ncbi:MAG: hypothetical protein IKF24_04055 [Eubacterium sp.]|nr:hypothetical protein [Eubacterium sp.]
MADIDKFTAKYDIAELKILMTTYYDRVRNLAEEYLAKTDWDEPDHELDLGVEYYENQINDGLEDVTPENMEYVATGALFNRFLIVHDGLMLHSSAVVVDGYAYLFSADSGTGKSTHTNLWLEKFGDKAFIINDDKPAIRKIDGEWYVYGTPWCGKNNTNKNAKAKLGAIVFLERSEENWIENESIQDAIKKFFRQTTRKLNKEQNMDKVLSTMEKVLSEVPIYKMGCNISEEAAKMAYEKIRRV